MFTANISSLQMMSRYRNDLDDRRLPGDYYQRVGRKGDTYRDYLTRTFLYLSTWSQFSVDDCIIAATETGNVAALEEFEESCRLWVGAGPSATHFAVATTSAAATSTNIMNGAMGGNYTLNAGSRSIELGLTVAGMFFRRHTKGSVHLFFEEIDANNASDFGYLRLGRENDRLQQISISPIDDVESTYNGKCLRFTHLSELIRRLDAGKGGEQLVLVGSDDKARVSFTLQGGFA